MGISGPYRSETNMDEYHIQVVNNPTKDYPNIPELNISNTNARALFNVLGIPFDWSGTIRLVDLKGKLYNVNEEDVLENDRDTQEFFGSETGQLRGIQFGLAAEQIKRYISELKKIVDYGVLNGFKELQWG